MKKLISIAIICSTVLSTSITAIGGNIPRVYLNNNKMLLQNSPFANNGSNYIPLRDVANNLGASVNWDNSTQTVTISANGNNIVQKIGENKAIVNGEVKEVSSPAILKNGTTYVPIRFVSENLGANIEYNQTTNQIYISYKMPTDSGKKYDAYGKLIRTTNLPSNANIYPYILQSLPNEMYQMPLEYDLGTWKITPVEGQHYIKPFNIGTDEWATQEHIRLWKNNFEKNLNLRLNVDYRTVNDTWMNELMDTYPSRYDIEQGLLDDYFAAGYKRELSEYMQYMKDNKIVIEGDYYVEPSTTYLTTGAFNMRVWVKFRINSPTLKSAKIYQKGSGEFKTNTWYSGYADLNCGTNNMGSDGSDLTIDNDNLAYSNMRGYIKEVQ